MVEHTGDVMYRLRFDTMRYDYMSPSIVRLTGYTVDEIHQVGWDAIVEKRMTMQGLAITSEDLRLQRLPESIGPFHADYLIRTKSGTQRWLEDRADPWHDQDGNLIGSIGLLSDITERKLLEDRLRQAQKMEAIGKLSGGVAHDFNNLLTVINGYADLLLGQSTSGTFAFDAATQILHAGESAAKLTGNLLAFSRQQMFAPQKLNLNTLLDRTTQILGRTIGEDIRFATVLAPELGSIMADPGQIEQVVMSLVSNAREAMPRGGKLTIQTSNVVLDATYARFHPGAKPGPYVMLAVGDTGHGMDAATIARIFEPFFTTKDERTVGKGAGLGLAAVYGIVDQCGGVIDVYSEPGIGTTFNIYFPRVDLPAVVANANVDHEDLPRGTETILVIEDERQVRTLTRHLLESSGYTVIEADGGDQALSLVAKRFDPIALLLSDVVMPGMSGPRIADELSKRVRDLKVIFMSGFTDDMMVRHGLVSGSVNFLQKPFTTAALVRKVRAVLDG
jgi:PAS domain S-box-containing protein